MDYDSLFPKLFELQKLNSRKTELARRVTEKDSRLRRWEIGGELSMHRRDLHQAYWDWESHIRYQQEYEDQLLAANKEYEAICEQIDSLIEEIESEIAAATS